MHDPLGVVPDCLVVALYFPEVILENAIAPRQISRPMKHMRGQEVVDAKFCKTDVIRTPSEIPNENSFNCAEVALPKKKTFRCDKAVFDIFFDPIISARDVLEVGVK
jgi:hypothetical protein